MTSPSQLLHRMFRRPRAGGDLFGLEVASTVSFASELGQEQPSPVLLDGAEMEISLFGVTVVWPDSERKRSVSTQSL